MIVYANKKEQKVIFSDDKFEFFSSYANGGYPLLLEKFELNSEIEITPEIARKAQIRY